MRALVPLVVVGLLLCLPVVAFGDAEVSPDVPAADIEHEHVKPEHFQEQDATADGASETGDGPSDTDPPNQDSTDGNGTDNNGTDSDGGSRKPEESEPGYDDGMFYIFMISMISMYTVPATGSKLYSWSVSASSTKNIEVDKFASRRLQEKKSQQFKSSLTFGNLFLAGAWALLLLCVYKYGEVSSDAPAIPDKFDPYEILALETDATAAEIKKAYRKLSLQYHPDKNQDDPSTEIDEQKEANNMFIRITKAHDTLTDEAAAENYRKYGNPDGSQGIKYGIGLPAFMFEQTKAVLVVYLLVLVVLIPVLVWHYVQHSRKYLVGQVMTDTYKFYHQFLNGEVTFKALIEVFSASFEFHRLVLPKKEQQNAIYNLYQELKAQERLDIHKIRLKNYLGMPTLQKNIIVLMAHMYRMTIPQELKADLVKVLELSPMLIQAMIDVIGGKQREELWKIWPRAQGYLSKTVEAVHFSQCLNQALWHKSSPLLQLPHITERELKYCKTITTLEQFMELDELARRKIFSPDKFTVDQLNEVNEFLDRYPKLEVIVDDPMVEGEDETWLDPTDKKVKPKIHENDRVSLKVTIKATRRKGANATPCLYNNPAHDGTEWETWWGVIGYPGRDRQRGGEVDAVLDLKKLVLGEKVEDEMILKFWAPRRRPKETVSYFELELHVMSHCYIGCELRDPKTRTSGIKLRLAVHDAAVAEAAEVKYFDSSDSDDEDFADEPSEDEDSDDEKDKTEPEPEPLKAIKAAEKDKSSAEAPASAEADSEPFSKEDFARNAAAADDVGEIVD